MQLIQLLADYFNGDHDFNLLCSVFMIVFMVQGKEIEFKVSCLARLLSYSLSVQAVNIFNFGGVWLTQQSPTSSHSLAVARHLVSDLTSSMGSSCSQLPSQSPWFSTNLVAAIGELYSCPTTAGPPPLRLVQLVASWLGHTPTTPNSCSPPAVSLLPWSVMSPL